ncbi:MAG TPA: hypothetical protein VGQ76_06645 [Thermoanaerobaculia bacterium]|jgi:hypothetical protein|nr:hypothetical protein [Thermoanaerobaculia bacterium]
MRKLAAVLLIVVASASYADKVKSKNKVAKVFEPVVREASAYAGSYRGPSESYGLVLEVAPDGKLRGNYVELGRVAVLHSIDVKGAAFSARASFDDGSWRTLSGSFANRVMNGKSAFGARVTNVLVEGMGAVDTFFEQN